MAIVHQTRRGHRFQDITGKTFGRLVVISLIEINARGEAVWLCRCQCGNERRITGYHLRRGHTQSCGCLRPERVRRHGKANSLIWGRWNTMVQRCTNPAAVGYQSYGARGITVCDRWRRFENFYADMGEPPTPLHSLDRYPDNDGNYEPGNVRWATRRQQNNNKRANRHLTFGGITDTISGWADRLGIKASSLKARIGPLGWSIERALTVAVKSRS